MDRQPPCFSAIAQKSKQKMLFYFCRQDFTTCLVIAVVNAQLEASFSHGRKTLKAQASVLRTRRSGMLTHDLDL